MGQVFGYWVYGNGKENGGSNILINMYEAVKHQPHAGFHFNIQDAAGFGQTSASKHPTDSPVYLSQEQLLFAASGRIDNRADLLRQIGNETDPQCSDETLILQCYLKWGKASADYLRGNWVFTVFDYKKQELFISRDPMGYTSLYYYQDKTGFYFGSSVKSILAVPSYQKQLNELQLVRYLTLWNDTKTGHDTYFKNVYSLPVAHSLTVCQQNITVARYWNPADIPVKHYKNKQRYSDEMLELFTRSVKRSIAKEKDTASMLSGGLDSSSVSFIAAELLKQQQKELSTFSHVPLYPNQLVYTKEYAHQVLDETPFIIATAEASGNIHPYLLKSENRTLMEGLRAGIDIVDAPSHGPANIYWILDIYETAAAMGFGCMLTGEGGNASISFAGTDYLLPWNLKTLVLHPYRFIRTQIAKPIGLTYFKNYLNRKRGTSQTLEKYVQNIFAQPSILQQYDILNDIRKNGNEMHLRIHDIRERKQLFLDLCFGRIRSGAAFSHHFGLELRDPTVDRDLMDFFFSIPNEVFFDEHYNNRMLMKRMMKGRLPDKVLLEKRKGLQNADIKFRAKAQASEISASIEAVTSSAAANHYIDMNRLAQTWQQYLKQDDVLPNQLQRLFKALQFAMFLQMHFD